MPKNIYGVTKVAAEDLCELFHHRSARRDLGWAPRNDFVKVLELIESEGVAGSPLARIIGSKGYHADRFDEGPYPVE